MKSPQRQGKILFVDALNQVSRVQAQSFLKEEHLLRILTAYQQFVDEPGLATVATFDEVASREFSLSIPLYVRRQTGNVDKDTKTLKQAWADWEQYGEGFWQEMDNLVEMLDSLAK